MAVAECVARGGEVPLSFGEEGLSELLKFPVDAPSVEVAMEPERLESIQARVFFFTVNN